MTRGGWAAVGLLAWVQLIMLWSVGRIGTRLQRLRWRVELLERAGGDS